MKISVVERTILVRLRTLHAYDPFIRPIFWAVRLSGLLSLFLACQTENPDPKLPAENLCFPPTGEPSWETVTPQELDWEIKFITELEKLFEENGTRALSC